MTAEKLGRNTWRWTAATFQHKQLALRRHKGGSLTQLTDGLNPWEVLCWKILLKWILHNMGTSKCASNNLSGTSLSKKTWALRFGLGVSESNPLLPEAPCGGQVQTNHQQPRASLHLKADMGESNQTRCTTLHCQLDFSPLIIRGNNIRVRSAKHPTRFPLLIPAASDTNGRKLTLGQKREEKCFFGTWGKKGKGWATLFTENDTAWF